MITAAWIVATISAILALALELIPGLRKRWETLGWEQKRFAWLVGCLILGAAPWVLGCTGRILNVTITFVSWAGSCEIDTLATRLQLGFTAYFASQATHGAAHAVQTATNNNTSTKGLP
jgi:hypothetical protein